MALVQRALEAIAEQGAERLALPNAVEEPLRVAYPLRPGRGPRRRRPRRLRATGSRCAAAPRWWRDPARAHAQSPCCSGSATAAASASPPAVEGLHVAAGAQALHPAVAAHVQAFAVVLAQVLEPLVGDRGHPGVEPAGRQPERLAEKQLEPLGIELLEPSAAERPWAARVGRAPA